MTTKTKLYAEICKTEKQDDGTLKVWGYASSEGIDSDGEIITADAMKAALPDYLKFGAVREMHQPIAAGTAIEAEVQDDGRTFFGALVVDPVAVKKVETGVYKGFSIGGKVTGRDEIKKHIITGLRLVEVSLVDRPANPEAVFTMFKADGLDVADEGEPTDKTEGAGDLRKGMYDVREFAACLQSLAYIAGSAEGEAQWEGDASPVPAQLRDWLAQGLAIFQAMAKEEADELMAQLNAAAKAEQDGDLAKRGAKFSSATKAALKAAHDACRAADKALADLGYEKDDEDGEGDDADKAAQAESLAKLQPELQARLAKFEGENADLKKRVAELEAMPAAPKAALKAIAKTDDSGSAVKVDEVPTSPLDAIKKAHQTGGVRIC